MPQIYVVEGIQEDECLTVTGDVILADSEDRARDQIEQIRNLRSWPWFHQQTTTLEEFIDGMEKVIERLQALKSASQEEMTGKLNSLIEESGGARCDGCGIVVRRDDLPHCEQTHVKPHAE